MSTPETIYLIPGEYEEGLVWCDDPAPSSYNDPAEAVKYVRADTLPVVTDNGKVNVGLIAENERLQVRVAELECMVKVFRGCIDTQVLPGQGSRCHKIVWELVGAPELETANSDDWTKCSERMPNLGQRVILKSRGVVQNYMPVFDQGDDDRGMGDHFWDFEDVNKIDNPLVDFEKDCWMPKPKQEQGQ